VDEVSRFYRVPDQSAGTHLALRWKGRVRYTVPREAAGQRACWNVFRPGALGIPLRAMARLPSLLGSAACTEGAQFMLIREAMGREAGFSCCRAGAAGPWSKDTILLLDRKSAKPLYFVKAGVSAAVDVLLQNEANWLQKLRDDKTLAEHIPEFVAHRSGKDLCFVAQCPVSGNLEFRLGALQLDFLRKLQESSLQPMRYEDSSLCRTLSSRFADLNGLLPEAWSTRIEKAMRRINESLSGSTMLFVTAHNDFTPWNIRVQHNRACVFDWEHAANEQLPLFDPLHFALLPMGLKDRPANKMVLRMHETLQLCRRWFGKELCYEMQAQALAYLVSLCTLYFSSERGQPGSSPVLESYARVIDSTSYI
jgi:Phosphotransferase enzyme family